MLCITVTTGEPFKITHRGVDIWVNIEKSSPTKSKVRIVAPPAVTVQRKKFRSAPAGAAGQSYLGPMATGQTSAAHVTEPKTLTTKGR
jgi:hypothetical protein